MIAVEVRAAQQPNFVARGVNTLRNKVSEALGKPPRQTSSVEYHPIPAEPVEKLVFGEIGRQALTHIVAAMAQPDNHRMRLEDNFTLQMALGEQEYHSLEHEGQAEEAMVTMSDVLAMSEIRLAYRACGLGSSLERDLPTPEKIAEAIETVHQIDEETNSGIIFFGNRLITQDIAPIRKILHNKVTPDKFIGGTIKFVPNEGKSA